MSAIALRGHHLGHDLQVRQELVDGLERVVVVAGVLELGPGQTELHAVGQLMGSVAGVMLACAEVVNDERLASIRVVAARCLSEKSIAGGIPLQVVGEKYLIDETEVFAN
ncbi:hypothetical protein HCU66_10305 [Pseudomonas frederiksbergensis]|uniref:hypothetical protein n=1 Tax=Pseudomonas frederiksbergensis TaxID=104087 RepID=UPI001980FE7B|nr:hypothetical protein [Pseudomonas frederiksbergensis]MBN3862614.1 hypothetical protein [Pseudomonas frederiksbergensis]